MYLFPPCLNPDPRNSQHRVGLTLSGPETFSQSHLSGKAVSLHIVVADLYHSYLKSVKQPIGQETVRGWCSKLSCTEYGSFLEQSMMFNVLEMLAAVQINVNSMIISRDIKWDGVAEHDQCIIPIYNVDHALYVFVASREVYR